MIVGAKEFISAAQKKFEGIQADIAELEKSIQELEAKIDTENEFKIDTIKKNKAIQSEINMYKTALDKACKKRDEIRKENGKTAYKEVSALINAFRREQRPSTNEKNLAIIEKVEEIRKLREEIQEQDKAIQQEIADFIDQAQLFLDPEPKTELILFGDPTKQYDYLKHTHSKSFLNGGTTFVNEVKEHDLGIKGGLFEVSPSVKSKVNELKESFHQ